MSMTRDEKKMEATIRLRLLLPFALVGYLDSGLFYYNHYLVYIYKDLRCPGAEEKERVTIYLRRLLLDFKSQILDKY